MKNTDYWALGFIVILLIYALIEWPALVAANNEAPDLRRPQIRRRRRKETEGLSDFFGIFTFELIIGAHAANTKHANQYRPKLAHI